MWMSEYEWINVNELMNEWMDLNERMRIFTCK